MKQNLTHYKNFYAVARNGSFSKAANELFISQPAISKSIKSLESSLETQLFIRTSRGVILTEDGELLMEKLKVAFLAISEGENLLKRKNELGIGHITIGVSSTLCKYLLLPYLSKYSEQNPHTQITIECHSSSNTLRLLHENKVDIGLVGVNDIITTDHFTYLTDINYIFASTPTYMNNLKIRGIEQIDDIFKYGNVMLLDKNNNSRQFIENYLLEQQLDIPTPFEVNNMVLITDFTKIGLGIGCVIKEFVQDDLDNGNLIELPLPNSIPTRKIGFVFNQNTLDTPAVKAFRKLI